ncbi:hypothetical protein ACFCYN_14965 [Gottfriedia sp. NPDC056225]|uniref:hypothetical protein n=1 Tax=Gottfriedia sp. NPDC056225 TaxID=3345751 RepID=UPI0035D5E488
MKLNSKFVVVFGILISLSGFYLSGAMHFSGGTLMIDLKTSFALSALAVGPALALTPFINNLFK